jgi:hypothetical protein
MTYKIITLSLTIISVALLIGSFLCPPTGVIDGSVLAAVGEIFAFAALWFAKDAIINHEGSVEVHHGKTGIKIETIDNDEEDTIDTADHK